MHRSILMIAALLLAAPAARAEAPTMFQVGLLGGYRTGGSLEDRETGDDRDFEDGSSFAVSFEVRYAKGDDRFYQLWYSRQATEVDDGIDTFDADVEYLHIGGTLPFNETEHVKPYFAAGLGATRFSASGPGTDDQTGFSGSAAFGLEIPLARHAAIRLEARGYLTAVDTEGAFFCSSNDGEGVCRIVASGSTVFQAEALAGFLVRF